MAPLKSLGSQRQCENNFCLNFEAKLSAQRFANNLSEQNALFDSKILFCTRTGQKTKTVSS